MLGRASEINAMQVYNWIPVCQGHFWSRMVRESNRIAAVLDLAKRPLERAGQAEDVLSWGCIWSSLALQVAQVLGWRSVFFQQWTKADRKEALQKWFYSRNHAWERAGQTEDVLSCHCIWSSLALQVLGWRSVSFQQWIRAEKRRLCRNNFAAEIMH